MQKKASKRTRACQRQSLRRRQRLRGDDRGERLLTVGEQRWPVGMGTPTHR